MQDNLEDLLTIDQLVDLTGYSRRHIERVFKENLGLSPYSFYRELRLDHARVLLGTTNKPLIEVAIMSGFNSVHNFSRRFKEKFGIPPPATISPKTPSMAVRALHTLIKPHLWPNRVGTATMELR